MSDRPSLAPIALIAAAGLMAPGAVLAEAPPAADAPMATAQGAAAPPTTTEQQIQTFIDDGAAQEQAPPQPDRKPHGFVSVGAGTHGYREVAGAVTLPVGQTGEVMVAIDDARIDGRR